MARIRIIDEWLRSPASEPLRQRAVMVVADTWAEQRVLMRAYASSADQTRPTISLHGAELAIGPAGLHPHGEWGIHVEPPVDGRAQELRGMLELAARRLAGTKGNPPRLLDEVSAFDRKVTNHWAPGTPPDTPERRAGARQPYYEPADVAPSAETAAIVAGSGRATVFASAKPVGAPPPPALAPGPRPSTPNPAHRRRARRTTDRFAGRTVLGFGSNPGFAGSAAGRAISPAPAPADTASLAVVVGHTMPLGFRLGDAERRVLNALGQSRALSASEVAEIAGVADGVEWMESLMSKLAEHGLDVVTPGDDRAGEPTYLLRR